KDLLIELPSLEEQNRIVSETKYSHVSGRSRPEDYFRVKRSGGIAISRNVQEREIIGSIQHRISQYLSPISNDLSNLKNYQRRQANEGSVVSMSDKISARENAATIEQVFERLDENISRISLTFELMKNVLYFDKNTAQFKP